MPEHLRAPSIHARFADRVTFASHQCDVPILRNLEIRNPTDRDLESVTLRLTSDPKVLGDRVWHIDRVPAGGEILPSDRSVALAGGLLADLTERMRADVRLELHAGDAILAVAEHRLEALARNEWGGGVAMPELLAAFATPNDPAVARLLREASRLLASKGARDSFEGYQGRSRARAWEMVSAIWSAVAARHLTYVEPPASFERDGQKVRLPSQIESEGLATCLDTALLFAGAVEQAGLHPVVVLARGHALAGAWLQPQTFPGLVVEEAEDVRKRVAAKELVLFETTMVTGSTPQPFTAAIAEADRQLDLDHEEAFTYALDVRQARGRGITPLPTHGEAPAQQGNNEGTPAALPVEEAPELPGFDLEPEYEEPPTTPAARLERWKRSLLDLSKRNRLLNLKNSKTAIPIFCPDPAHLEDQLATGRRLRLVTPPPREGDRDATLYHLRTGDDLDATFAHSALERGEVVANVAPELLEKGAIELFRKARTDLQEGGANTLFLALGMLRWRPAGDSKSGPYRAPLILLPVRFERASAKSLPTLRNHEDEPVFNLTLLQMLRQDFQIEIPSLDGELPTDDHGIDVRRIWSMVRSRILDVPGLEVVEDVVLSTFSFAKYLMWKDLADRSEALKTNPFVRHVIDTPRESYEHGATFKDAHELDRELHPTDVLAPLNADSSQLIAIHASGGDGDFVIEGPPGTGKSETIANIVVHNLGLGRRVLFVSEKMAALEVVYRRLDAVGLGDFCLELHSAKANKKDVLGQLGAAWTQRAPHDGEAWGRKAARLSEIRERLNSLVTALHTPGPGGWSPRDAIGRTVRYGDVHRYRLDWERDPTGAGHAPTRDALEVLEDVANRVALQFGQLDPDDFAAFGSVAPSEWSFAWQDELVMSARTLAGAIRPLGDARDALVARLRFPAVGTDIGALEALASVARDLPAAARTDLSFALAPQGAETMDAIERIVENLRAYTDARRQLAVPYADDRIAASPIGDWVTAHATAEGKVWPMKVFAGRGLRRTMRTGLGVAKRSAPAPERDLDTLTRLTELRHVIDRQAAELPTTTLFKGLDTDVEAAVRALAAGRSLRASVSRLAGFGHDLMELRGRLLDVLANGRDQLGDGQPLAEAARKFVAAYDTFERVFERFRQVAGSDDATTTDVLELERATAAIAERETRLRDWSRWIDATREARAAGLGSLVDALQEGRVLAADAVAVFRTAYAAWLAPILTDARPELQRFSKVEHENLIETFRDLDREVAELTADFVRAKLSGDVPDRNARHAGSGFGVLARELQKQKRHKPVRQLVSEMGSDLMTLTPCLMMSPLSVSQFLPADQQAFDLVVFDEASQITVPDAIGAIARGKRCIIVGDPKQMPPTRFFERGADDDAADDAGRDLESILDEALAARVPLHRLTGHYRSRHESLIAFSNHAYYGGALVTYPAADTRDTAVNFHRVSGAYAKGKSRTNPIEAQALVAEVVRRLRDPELRRLSLGIVTLNTEQQRLVEDLLDDERRSDPSLEPFFATHDATDERLPGEPIFVKNLETVQGDQRDVILLSIGYGPTEVGAPTMSMNFGPLNREGGERRLNVAITRATTEVVVFASFDPSMIDLSRTKARAVADLKAYLDYASRGPRALVEAARVAGHDRYDSDFEAAVAEHLRQRGWDVRTQIGVSKFRIDLGIVHPDAPGRFLAGVECDGATYHRSPTARDRDRVRHIVLENLGWRLVRVWSTDFFVDERQEVERLDAKLLQILEADRSATPADDLTSTSIWQDDDAPPSDLESDDDPTEATDAEMNELLAPALSTPVPVPASARISGFTGAETPTSEPAGPFMESERFYDDDYEPTLRELAASIIDAEGPIVFRLLSERIARAHDFARTGKIIKKTVWRSVQRLRPTSRTPDEQVVFWPRGVEPTTTSAFRGLDDRRWNDVPYPEKLGLAEAAGSTDVDQVVRHVAAVAGIARVTQRLRDEVAELVERLERSY